MEGKALGKGLSALIPERITSGKDQIITHVKTGLVRDSALQPRKIYHDEKLEDLKISIQKRGVLQPILVRKKEDQFEVIAGERRLKAARALNLDEIPVIVKDVNDQEAFVIALVENIQREELNPIEEAEAYHRLIEEFGYTQETVAQSVGKDRSTISNLIRLLKLPENIRGAITAGHISFGHARALLSAETFSERDRLYALIMKNGLSVREVENLVQSKTKAGRRRGKIQANRNHDIVALEEDLQRKLGTKVRVMTLQKRGKIIIDFYSLDDLDRIIRLIKQ